MKEALYHKTLYTFSSGEKHVRSVGTLEKPWFERYLEWAFTLDSSGANLPQHHHWTFLREVQPDLRLTLPLMDDPDGTRLRRGIDAKGWYIANVLIGSGIQEEPIKVVEGTTGWWPENPSPHHRAITKRIKSDAAPNPGALTPEAEALLSQLRKP